LKLGIGRGIGLALAAAAALAGQRAPTAAPSQPARTSQPARIVAVGDLHGDYEAWIEIASRARLVDRRNRWAGGSAVLVQAGDIADRGPDSLKIFRHLIKLQKEAARAGGKVVVLVGNHEAMNMTGDLRYVHPGEFAAFANTNSDRLRELTYAANQAAIAAAYRTRSPDMAERAIHDAWVAQTPLGKLEHQLAWSPRGELGRWTIANPAVAKVGDTMFVHGGISLRYAALPPDEINRRTAAALASQASAPDSIINDEFGPLWYRGLAEASETSEAERQVAAIGERAAAVPSADEELSAALRSAGARRMVVAHTPDRSGIKVSHRGRLVRIDTGISRYYGGKLSYLEIMGDRLVPHSWDRSPAPPRRR
jgi:hypothetical protein